jgi:predicted phosphodiesterase
MTQIVRQIELDRAALIFGGPYSNLEATEALLAEARALGVEPSHIICTGDLAAYCASPAETIALLRGAGIHVVRGNTDEQLALRAGDCGCGFAPGSACDRLSAAWFAYADARIDGDARDWLRTLPTRIEATIGRRRLTVVHGMLNSINAFVFASSPIEVKLRELEATGADGIIASHSGLPFTQILGGKLWHNAGVIGLPANDGTPRVWYSLLRPQGSGLVIEHRALRYDHAAAARRMERSGLPRAYSAALLDGLWPSCDILPRQEKGAAGKALEFSAALWA